jgi:hypothetical protein
MKSLVQIDDAVVRLAVQKSIGPDTNANPVGHTPGMIPESQGTRNGTFEPMSRTKRHARTVLRARRSNNYFKRYCSGGHGAFHCCLELW